MLGWVGLHNFANFWDSWNWYEIASEVTIICNFTITKDNKAGIVTLLAQITKSHLKIYSLLTDNYSTARDIVEWPDSFLKKIWPFFWGAHKMGDHKVAIPMVNWIDLVEKPH